MTKRRVTVNQDPHFDGESEGIISDAEGKQVGINTGVKEETNPYHVQSLGKDQRMEKFNQTMKDY